MEGLFELNIQDPHQTWQSLKTADDARVCKIRQRLEELWQYFHPYADSNFRHEFAKHPHQRFWEMLLCVFLLESGKNVIAKRDRVQSGPDILVKEPGETIWIEAVTPTTGEPAKPDTVPDFQADGKAYSVPDDSLLLRFLQAMDEKRNRLQSYVDDSITASDDIHIIAINAGDQKGFGGFTGGFRQSFVSDSNQDIGKCRLDVGNSLRGCEEQRLRCPSKCLREGGLSRYHRCHFLPIDDRGYGKSNGGVPLLPQPQQ